ncbi:MAG: hypothetical protein HYV34_03245 [Candidatus Kerfeldbacteria bacterium]|nr:hypothetical protein [Candidatus Kerfeldbacteria bacterium]
MSYYISVRALHKEKNDKLWKEIADGKFSETLEKQLIDIEQRIQQLSGDLRIYSDSKLIEEANMLDDKKFRLSGLVNDIKRFRESLHAKDDQSIKEYIESIDSRLTDFYNEGLDYFDPRYPFHDFFSALFEIVLRVDIEKDWHGTLSLLPTEKWIELYKKIDGEAVNKAIRSMDENPEDREVQDDYVGLTREIRDILRRCIDTKSQFCLFDELYESGQEPQEKPRTNEILEKWFAS